MKYILIGLLVYWALCVCLAFRKGVFVENLRRDLPQLFILPLWMRTAILFIVFIFIAPMFLKEPFLFVREWYMNRKLRKIAKGLRKIAEDKSLNGNPELADDLKKIAAGMDELSKM
ncbi:MAG TPA: hypothetical protein PK228_10335 [Saprospiraceae bacterium]|nr:hypothetical protein [Saprospiraceae bacterium]